MSAIKDAIVASKPLTPPQMKLKKNIEKFNEIMVKMGVTGIIKDLAKYVY